MIRIAALCAILAGPACADTSHNGTSVDVSITAANGPHVAVIEMMNHLRYSSSSAPFDLDVGTLRVRVTIMQRQGSLPDTVSVEAPEGFIAVPMSIELAEGQAGEILIYSIEGVGM